MQFFTLLNVHTLCMFRGFIDLLKMLLNMLNVVTNNNYFGQQYVFPFNIYKTVASTNSQEHLLSSDQDKGRL